MKEHREIKWRDVLTDQNPAAEVGTREKKYQKLDQNWSHGPKCLANKEECTNIIVAEAYRKKVNMKQIRYKPSSQQQ